MSRKNEEFFEYDEKDQEDIFFGKKPDFDKDEISGQDKEQFEDKYELVFDIEQKLRERAKEMYYPRIFDKQKVGLFLFLKSFEK